MTVLPWTAQVSEQVRLLAMLRLADGWSQQDVADFLGISRRSVRRWQRSFRDEVASANPIRHAFRVTVRSTNGYVFPGSHRAGSTSGALPMGARLRRVSGASRNPLSSVKPRVACKSRLFF